MTRRDDPRAQAAAADVQSGAAMVSAALRELRAEDEAPAWQDALDRQFERAFNYARRRVTKATWDEAEERAQ